MGYKLENLTDQIDRVFGPSEPLVVDQGKIQGFADATGDQQWIHVDVERAKAESPFGGPIAHGYLVLSFIAAKLQELGVFPENASGVMNYGLEKARFVGPVLAGSRVTVTAKLTNVENKGEGRFLLHLSCTVQPEGSEEPVVIADALAMAFG